MAKFRLMPSIYLFNGEMVDKDTKEKIGDGDAVAQAILLNNLGADELLIFDLSSTDEEHEKNISTMIKISDEADIPTIVGGNVKRLEDVKKYLYSGAKKTFLDTAKESNRDLVKEAAERFGGDKIAVLIHDDFDFSKVKQLKYDGASLVIAENCARQCFGQGIRVVSYNAGIEAAEYVEMGIGEKVYGISDVSMDETYDYQKIKNELYKNGVSTNVFVPKFQFSDLKTNADGMIPVIVQDYKTNQVLMLAYMNEEAFNLTIATGKMTYYSRSRDEIWVKGETSSHYQYVKELSVDCDLDTMLAKVHQIGVPCHTGAETCFFNEVVKKDYEDTNPMRVFEDVYNVILDRKEHPKEGSYTNYLFDKGIDKILKKVGEEATEIVIAAKNPDPQEIKYEISDFLYHVMVLMAEKGVNWKEIIKELSRR
ncbi:MAG: bifunctional phosphoribosyl-AMP cyclohydrolase/phosphoribosyl-ATP diphosphatase HisIE [Eubacterium sp.]|nr:bifunctional phosphoribosyl-AMP cyclohydrolase/phosphoribosyl-ATP diphosphatase HisIE [Eubacterium sp.]